MGKNRVSYGGRAFQQDASLAMRGDIVRGIIEVVTNCDDAYGDSDGKIRIEIDRHRGRPSQLVVRDRARGMSAADMKDKIGGLGGRTSGFELGEEVRGNLGRGAKDLAAFGPAQFESIFDQKYSKLVLEEDGSYDDPVVRKADQSDRARLGVPRGNGTVVSVTIGERFKIPQHAKLLSKLAHHFQLRDINSDPRREITLVDVNNRKSDAIRYGKPSLPEVHSSDLAIDGYPEAVASLTIYRNHERYENGTSDTGRPEGLLIKGRRAIYENSLFAYESNPYAHWFSGVVKCPYIDSIAATFDNEHANELNHSASNPMPIITRSRDGLEHDHPFHKALAQAVESVLGEFARAEQERAQSGAARESTRLRRTLDLLGRDLGKLLDADLREIDEDGLTGAGHGGKEETLRIIPQSPVLYMGESKTLSIVSPRLMNATEAQVEVDPEGVVELVDGPTIPMTDHPRRLDLLIGRVRLTPLIEDEETFLTVRLGDQEVSVVVEVRPEREDPDPTAPEEFQFERERYQMTVGKRRTIRLLAPVEVVDDHGLTALLTSSSQDVVVMGTHVELDFDDDQLCYVGTVSVDPRVLGAKATLSATLGSCETKCTAIVVQEETSGPSIEIVIVDEAAGKYRARVERTGQRTVIKILGGHPAIKRYLGTGPEFPCQDTLQARAVIAEVIAGEAARMIIEKKFAVAGELDGPAFYAEHTALLTKYLGRCHKMMVSDAELPTSA